MNIYHYAADTIHKIHSTRKNFPILFISIMATYSVGHILSFHYLKTYVRQIKRAQLAIISKAVTKQVPHLPRKKPAQDT